MVNLDPEKEQIDMQFYVPRLLYLRILRRNRLKLISVSLIVLNIIFLIIGFLFLDNVWRTRKYIIGGDDFWDEFKVRDYSDYEIQNYSAFTSAFSILSGVFNIMNQTVILKHLELGGLKIRLAFAQWIHLVLNIGKFIYSIIPLAKFTYLVRLFPAYFALNLINLTLTIVFIIFSTKVVRKEIAYMIAMKMLYKHREEYYQDFVKKKKALIHESNEHVGNNHESQRNEENSDNNKIYIRNN